MIIFQCPGPKANRLDLLLRTYLKNKSASPRRHDHKNLSVKLFENLSNYVDPANINHITVALDANVIPGVKERRGIIKLILIQILIKFQKLLAVFINTICIIRKKNKTLSM